MFSFIITKGRYKGEAYKRDKTAIYLLKGRYDAKSSKGFTDEELEQFKSEWKESEKPEAIEAKIDRDDIQWNYFLHKYEAIGQELTMVGIKRWIKSDCLSRRKPIPRSSDVNRWAYSIYAITNNMTRIGDIQDLDNYANEQFIKVD